MRIFSISFEVNERGKAKYGFIFDISENRLGVKIRKNYVKIFLGKTNSFFCTIE